MATTGRKAWLITSEKQSGKGPVKVLAVLSPQSGFRTIERMVDMLYRAEHLDGSEKLAHMSPKTPPVYRPEWTRTTCECGQGDSLIVARRVTGLQEVPYTQGISSLVWDDMPMRRQASPVHHAGLR